MGGVQRKKRIHCGIKDFSKKCRTRRRTRDLDQIQEDLLRQKKNPSATLPVDLELPGLGQYPCVECNVFCISAEVLQKHANTKNHKKRLRMLLEVPYTIQEAEAAAGMGNALITERRPLLQTMETK